MTFDNQLFRFKGNSYTTFTHQLVSIFQAYRPHPPKFSIGQKFLNSSSFKSLQDCDLFLLSDKAIYIFLKNKKLKIYNLLSFFMFCLPPVYPDEISDKQLNYVNTKKILQTCDAFCDLILLMLFFLHILCTICWWFAYDFTKNMIMQIMINLPQILV